MGAYWKFATSLVVSHQVRIDTETETEPATKNMSVCPTFFGKCPRTDPKDSDERICS